MRVGGLYGQATARIHRRTRLGTDDCGARTDRAGDVHGLAKGAMPPGGWPLAATCAALPYWPCQGPPPMNWPAVSCSSLMIS